MVNFGTATLAPPRSNVFNLRRGGILEDLIIGVGQRLKQYQETTNVEFDKMGMLKLKRKEHLGKVTPGRFTGTQLL